LRRLRVTPPAIALSQPNMRKNSRVRRTKRLGHRQVRWPLANLKGTHLEDMHMIGDLLSPPEHVRAVATWVMDNAQQVDRANFDFNASFAGFSAEAVGYQDQRSTYFIFEDTGGHYVYIRKGGLERAPEIANNVAPAPIEPPRRRRTLAGPGM
jgi:hypothetical protein